MGVGIGVGHRQTVRRALLQTELKAAVGGVGIAKLIRNASKNGASIGRILWIAQVINVSKRFVLASGRRRQQSWVDVAAVLQVSPLAAHEASGRQPILGDLILDVQAVLHCGRSLEIRAHPCDADRSNRGEVELTPWFGRCEREWVLGEWGGSCGSRVGIDRKSTRLNSSHL